MASDGDLRAAQLARAGLSYTTIAEQLGYRDRRAAHRAVLRGLAVPAEEEAARRELRMREVDAQLTALQLSLWRLWDQMDPMKAGIRRYLQVVDALLRVSDRRCRLWGLYTHPYRCDTWYRRDVPVSLLVAAQRLVARLEDQANIPPSRRMAPRKVAPVIALPVAAVTQIAG
ncbi:MAG: hypothetical protein JO287_12435, partial [Pseudonocardiales bacterium]|nr:hypothetical protein [Pseudonocardiales bacterium]